MMGLESILSPASLGLDAAQIAAVNELTNWVKERLDEYSWDDKFARFYFLIPFGCAGLLCVLNSGFSFDFATLKCAGMYGLGATLAWRGWRNGVQNR